MTDELLPALPDEWIGHSELLNQRLYTAEQMRAYAREAIRQQWRPISEAPKQKHPMIVVCGHFADRNYITDPWCVFWQEESWQRWPHSDPPTHFMPLPVLLPAPPAGEVA